MRPLVGLIALAVSAVSIARLDGCDPNTSKPQTAASAIEAQAPKCASAHRFEKTDVYPMNLRADIALDSCTGQICRTWDWEAKGNAPSAWKTYQYSPLCADLAKKNP